MKGSSEMSKEIKKKVAFLKSLGYTVLDGRKLKKKDILKYNLPYTIDDDARLYIDIEDFSMWGTLNSEKLNLIKVSNIIFAFKEGRKKKAKYALWQGKFLVTVLSKENDEGEIKILSDGREHSVSVSEISFFF